MKPLLLFVFAFLAAANGFAQYSRNQTTLEKLSVAGDSSFRNKVNFLKSKPDTGIDKDVLPYNGMPNAFSRKYPPDIYVGNNGQGQDIYRSQLDNMPILKPDSSFKSGMSNSLRLYKEPVKTYPSFGYFPPDASTIPKGNKQPKK